MDDVPDVQLLSVLSYLPPKSHLPICHVSHRFRSCWLEMKRAGRKDIIHTSKRSQDDRGTQGISLIWAQWQEQNGANSFASDDAFETSPLQIGNIFKSPWNKPGCGTLRTSLLRYYMLCGWDGATRIRKVMHGAAARGDTEGMAFLAREELCNLEDEELCTVAGAAGQLDALKWLKEEKGCPWDPTEVYREASENLHEDVMTYIEKNSEDHCAHKQILYNYTCF